jgi:aspartate/methionine/tyrosine aminotransferase
VVDVSGPIPAERLALAAFRSLDRLETRARAILEPNRRAAREFLAGRGDLECAPFAASLAFPRFRSGESATPFAQELGEREGVAVVPGEFFGLPSHFRLSLGGSPELLREGLEAVGRVLETFRVPPSGGGGGS